jgi:transposase
VVERRLQHKNSFRCDGNGRPITFLLTVGERYEMVVFEQLMEQGEVKRSKDDRSRLRPKRVSADKGYSSNKVCHYLRRRGKFDKLLYRQRSWIERCFNRLKQFRQHCAIPMPSAMLLNLLYPYSLSVEQLQKYYRRPLNSRPLDRTSRIPLLT